MTTKLKPKTIEEDENGIPKIKIEYADFYTPAMCRKNPTKIFVFGDNSTRQGKKGQSEIRGEPNAFGVVTKHSPNTYFNDKNYYWNVHKIFIDLRIIQKAALKGKGRVIVWPKDGIGTGLAELRERAPVTWEALQRMQYAVLGVLRTK
jgi:hypothetical protein